MKHTNRLEEAKKQLRIVLEDLDEATEEATNLQAALDRVDRAIDGCSQEVEA